MIRSYKAHQTNINFIGDIMSIQSTINITRAIAIERIVNINFLRQNKEYRILENVTFEPDFNIESFVDEFDSEINEYDLSKYTNKMLENILDKPFYRFTMFDNYIIIDD